MDVESSFSTKIVTVPVDIVNFEVNFSRFYRFWVIHYESVFFLLHKTIKLPEFWDGVKENNNLWFGLKFGNFLQNIENDIIFICTSTIEVIDSNQSFILIFRIKLYKIMASQVILNKFPKIIFISCSWCDKELNYELFTLAVELFTCGLAIILSILLNYPRVSSLTLSHSSNMTHFNSVK